MTALNAHPGALCSSVLSMWVFAAEVRISLLFKYGFGSIKKRADTE